MGIHQLFHSSCCFLNTNTAITQQLIRTARTLEAESLQVCGKRDYGDKGRWVKYLARLGRWISPCYSPFSLGAPFLKLWTVYFFNFPIFFSARGQPRIRRSTCTWNCSSNPSTHHNSVILNSAQVQNQFLSNRSKGQCKLIQKNSWSLKVCGGIAPLILNVGARCMWAIRFTLQPLYPAVPTE